MRDIELEPLADDPLAVPPTVGDDAFASKPPGGVNAAVGLADVSFTTDAAYTQPGTGGEFGPGRAKLVSGPADGGVADMAAPAAGAAQPALVIPKAAYAMTGRSANQTTRLNLYPWFKSPRQGLDQNNPAVVPAEDPQEAEPSGIEITALQLDQAGIGILTFSGPAARDATIHIVAAINGGPDSMLDVPVTAGMTASQIAAAVRAQINDTDDDLEAHGTGGTVSVECSLAGGEAMTKFQVTVI